MSAEATKKRTPFDAFMNGVMKMAGPLSKFASLPAIAAIQEGLIAVMPLILIGSMFLVVSLFGTDSIGGTVLIPFLAPVASKLSVMKQLTMGFMGVYASVTIGCSFAEKIGVDSKTSGLLSLAIFFTFNFNGVSDDGTISTTAFSATGLFAVMISTLIGIWLYKLILDRDITIKMPAGVPPAVGNAFTSLIPFALILSLCWIIRTVLDFDFVTFLTTFLTPYISAADNIWMYTFERTVSAILWASGLHGDNMWNTPIFAPFQMMWGEENAVAAAAGKAIPHVWVYGMTDRMTFWPATVWPLVFLMIRSKVDYLRKLGWACLPASIFSIVEPVVFGLPIALNAFLIVPFVVIAVITQFLTYGAFALGIFSKFFAMLPWATPAFILGPLGTGDIKTAILPFLAFAIGLVIYIPFWRMFEKSLLQKQEEEFAAEQAAALEASGGASE